MSENEFVDGLFVKPPHGNAPDFVRASISINKPVFIAWLEKQTGPWVIIDTNESRAGNWYSKLNTFVPKPPEFPKAEAPAFDDVPF
jgi:hypothetical protein